MSQCISILGATGSIGRQALEVVSACGLSVCALTAHRNVALLEEQVRAFRPQLAVMTDTAAAADLKVRLADTNVRVLAGQEALLEAAALPQADTVLTAVVGVAGLAPTLAAIYAKKRIALANKETLVCAGELVMDEAAACGAEILPVDSEHSAIFQCLQGANRGEVRRLILTASGGPFFGYTPQQLENVTLAQALKHPNWAMGAKVTVDSATLMNKGLELIEAMRLYRMPLEKVSILVHRESIVHSLVEYCDGAVLAQLGAADMRLPIQYAFTWPARRAGPSETLDLCTCPPLTFCAPDLNAFPCLRLAMNAAATGGTACAILSGANEAAVELFLQGRIPFSAIALRVAAALAAVKTVQKPALDDIFAADLAARAAVLAAN